MQKWEEIEQKKEYLRGIHKSKEQRSSNKRSNTTTKTRHDASGTAR